MSYKVGVDSGVLKSVGIRVGSVAVTVGLTSVAITFSSAMPDANYIPFVFMSGVAVSFTISSPTVNGFSVTFTAGLSGTLNWRAEYPV